MTIKEKTPQVIPMVKCKVLSRYGDRQPGEFVMIEEYTYRKQFRPLLDAKQPEPEMGPPIFEVLISEADLAEREERLAREKIEHDKAAAAAAEDSMARANSLERGWQNYQQRSLEHVRAQQIKDQETLRENLLGLESTPLTAQETQEKFRKDVAAGRER